MAVIQSNNNILRVGNGGSQYFAGDYIDIDGNNTISVDYDLSGLSGKVDNNYAELQNVSAGLSGAVDYVSARSDLYSGHIDYVSAHVSALEDCCTSVNTAISELSGSVSTNATNIGVNATAIYNLQTATAVLNFEKLDKTAYQPGVSDPFSARFNVGPGIYYDATAVQIGANPFTNDAAISLTDGTYSASVVGMKSAGNGIVMHTGSSGFYTEPKTAWYFLITADTTITVPASAGGTMTIVGPKVGGFDTANVTLNSGDDVLLVESGNWFNLVAVPDINDTYTWALANSGNEYIRPNT